MKLNIERDGFRLDNTDGYSRYELDRLNAELETRLENVKEDDMDTYYAVVKGFSDELDSNLANIFEEEIHETGQ